MQDARSAVEAPLYRPRVTLMIMYVRFFPPTGSLEKLGSLGSHMRLVYKSEGAHTAL